MNRKRIIELAESCGLLYNKDIAPYNNPAQQRLISKLENFAKMLEKEICNENPVQDSE